MNIINEDEILPKSFNNYEEYINSILDFFNCYNIIFVNNIYNEKNELIYINKSVHSLIVKDYEKLPKEFLLYFNNIKNFLNLHQEQGDAILEFLMDFSTDQLPTIPSKYYDEKQKFKELFKLPKELENFFDLSRKLSPNVNEANLSEPYSKEWYEIYKKDSPSPSISTILMNQKKKYEIKLFGDEIIKEAKKQGINTIIDVGCGKGYLTNYISMNSNLRSIGIEGNEDNIDKMMLRVDKIEQISKQKISKAEGYTSFLTSETTIDEFKKITKIDNNEEVLLTGLHPCGDLTPILMRLFKNLNQIKSLMFVGCCYNKLTENPKFLSLTDNEINNQSKNFGFPLSDYLLFKNKIKFHLSNNYISSNPHPSSRTREEWLYAYKMRSFRAVLELFIHNNLPKYLEVHYIGQIREKYSDSFGLYLEKALVQIQKYSKKFEITNKNYYIDLNNWIKEFSSKNDIVKIGNDFYQSLKPYNNILFESVVMTALEARISQILEGLIVCDRVLFLKQFCSNVSARRLFHPLISARGIIITALK